MMPFSVLRIWGTGILSWAILIGAGYCFYEWYQKSHVADAERPRTEYQIPRGVNVNSREPADGLAPTERVVRIERDRRNDANAGKFLACGIGLLAISTVGFLPVLLVLGKPGGAKCDPGPRTSHFTVRRDDGTELNVEVYGSSDLPTVVCVHGWSLDRTAWYYAAKDLGDRCRVVVWDLPGLGRSRGPRNGDFSLEKMAGDLAAVLEKFEGPVLLVGHSIGGMIIQTFCRLYAQQVGVKVAGIVLEQTTYTNPLNTALGAAFWKTIEKPILTPLNQLTIWLAPLAWLSNWQSYFNGSLHIMTRIASLSGRQTWGQLNHGALLQAKAWPAVVARGNFAMTRFDEQQTLPRIAVPVLVIAGENDRMTLPVASERLESMLGNAVPARLKAGHLGLWEQAETLADLIAEFAHRCLSYDEQQKGREANHVVPQAGRVGNPVSRQDGV